MDRTEIQNQNIVPRYVSGEISLREAREFEKFCFDNPDFVESLPIPIRARLKTLRPPNDDALLIGAMGNESYSANEDDDDEEDAAPTRWKNPDGARKTVTILSFVLIAAAAGIAFLLFNLNAKDKEMQRVLREARAMQLQPPSSIQPIRTSLSDNKPSAPTVNVGAPNPARFIDMSIDVSKETYNMYLVTIEDVTRGRVMQIRRLARDTNKELRLTLNSSAFGAGDYTLQFDGYTWRGDTVPVGWIRLGLK